jgi:preprotein translocase subunit Sec63
MSYLFVFCSRNTLSRKKLLFVTKLLTIHLRRLKSGNYAGQRNAQIKATNTNVLSTALLACESDQRTQTVQLGVTNNLRWGTV